MEDKWLNFIPQHVVANAKYSHSIGQDSVGLFYGYHFGGNSYGHFHSYIKTPSCLSDIMSTLARSRADMELTFALHA